MDDQKARAIQAARQIVKIDPEEIGMRAYEAAQARGAFPEEMDRIQQQAFESARRSASHPVSAAVQGVANRAIDYVEDPSRIKDDLNSAKDTVTQFMMQNALPLASRGAAAVLGSVPGIYFGMTSPLNAGEQEMLDRQMWQRQRELQDEEQPENRASGGRLLQDTNPTHYMPHVGRQVMGKGGNAKKGQTVDLAKSILAENREIPVQKTPETGRGAMFEVAPGKKWDAEQQKDWETLHPDAKQAVSNKMIGEFLSKWQRMTGIHGEVRPGLGGFGGYTNPNYVFEPYDPNHITHALNGLGELFRQDAMMGAHAQPFEGSFPSGVVRIALPHGATADEVHSVYEKLHKAGLAEGHTTDVDGRFMDILAGTNGEQAAKVGKKIADIIGDRYDVAAYPTNIAFPEKETNYGISGTSFSGPPGASPPEALADLQTKASQRLGELLQEAKRQGSGFKGKVSFGDTLAPGEPHPDVVSAGVPTTAKAYKGPPLPGEAREDISPSKHSPKNLSAIASRMWAMHPASGGEELDGPEALEKINNFHVKNLLALWDRTPVNQRKMSRFWYRAAHAVGNAYASEHGLEPRQAHGMMAVLSPQTPWDKNVTLAERVMNALTHHQDTPWTRAMTEVARRGGSSGKGLPISKGTKETGKHTWEDIEGKTLREVLQGPHPEMRGAMWVRAFDEAHNPTEYHAISPNGEFQGVMMNKSGTAPDTSSWNSYLPISKAISIYYDPSLENINKQLGNNHKVREFYNVIANPHDPNGAVVDTHAVAAGQLLPHGSSAKAVHQNFGTTPVAKAKEQLAKYGEEWRPGIDPSKKTGSTGAVGDFPIHSEAIRQAAWARGVHPSEMQSVTWETVRSLFSNKSQPQQKAIRAIWQRYANGELSHGQAVDEIFKTAGFKDKAWQEQDKVGLGDIKTGSYQRPTTIDPEAPPVQRYGPKPVDEEQPMSTGGTPHEPHQRAEEQGYSIRGYHVTRGPRAKGISSSGRFSLEHAANPDEEAVFFWDKPEAANDWAHSLAGVKSFNPSEMSEREHDRAERHQTAILPVRINPGKHLEVNWPEFARTNYYNSLSMEHLLNHARENGYDTVRIKNMIEDGVGNPDNPAHDQIAVLNPHLIRSEYAKFDPARQHEDDIGAYRGGEVN